MIKNQKKIKQETPWERINNIDSINILKYIKLIIFFKSIVFQCLHSPISFEFEY